MRELTASLFRVNPLPAAIRRRLSQRARRSPKAALGIERDSAPKARLAQHHGRRRKSRRGSAPPQTTKTRRRAPSVEAHLAATRRRAPAAAATDSRREHKPQRRRSLLPAGPAQTAMTAAPTGGPQEARATATAARSRRCRKERSCRRIPTPTREDQKAVGGGRPWPISAEKFRRTRKGESAGEVVRTQAQARGALKENLRTRFACAKQNTRTRRGATDLRTCGGPKRPCSRPGKPPRRASTYDANSGEPLCWVPLKKRHDRLLAKSAERVDAELALGAARGRRRALQALRSKKKRREDAQQRNDERRRPSGGAGGGGGRRRGIGRGGGVSF